MVSTTSPPRVEFYQFIEVIGQGSSGQVWKARYVGSERRGKLAPNTCVAIKLVLDAKIIEKEVLIQTKLRHLNIVQMFDIFECAS